MKREKRLAFAVTVEDIKRIRQSYQGFVDRLPEAAKESPPKFTQWIRSVLLSVDEAGERMARLEAELAAERHATSIAMSFIAASRVGYDHWNTMPQDERNAAVQHAAATVFRAARAAQDTQYAANLATDAAINEIRETVH